MLHMYLEDVLVVVVYIVTVSRCSSCFERPVNDANVVMLDVVCVDTQHGGQPLVKGRDAAPFIRTGHVMEQN